MTIKKKTKMVPLGIALTCSLLSCSDRPASSIPEDPASTTSTNTDDVRRGQKNNSQDDPQNMVPDPSSPENPNQGSTNGSQEATPVALVERFPYYLSLSAVSNCTSKAAPSNFGKDNSLSIKLPAGSYEIEPLNDGGNFVALEVEPDTFDWHFNYIIGPLQGTAISTVKVSSSEASGTVTSPDEASDRVISLVFPFEIPEDGSPFTAYIKDKDCTDNAGGITVKIIQK